MEERLPGQSDPARVEIVTAADDPIGAVNAAGLLLTGRHKA
jgi:hypothetical protein